MNVPLWAWAAVLAVILAMLAVDLFAHRVCTSSPSVRRLCGARLGDPRARVRRRRLGGYGAQAAGEYFAGYLIEKSLAVDNVFVFALIFTYFAVPRAYQHRVLFFGVLGALVLRAIFIAGGLALIDQFHWVLYVFGALLVLTGWRMFRHRDGRWTRPRTRCRAFDARARHPDAPTDTTGRSSGSRQAGRLGRHAAVHGPAARRDHRPHLRRRLHPRDLRRHHRTRSWCSPATPSRSWACGPCTSCSPTSCTASSTSRPGWRRSSVFVGVKMLLIDVVKVPIWLSLGVIATSITVAVVASLRATRGEPTSSPEAVESDRAEVER